MRVLFCLILVHPACSVPGGSCVMFSKEKGGEKNQIDMFPFGLGRDMEGPTFCFVLAMHARNAYNPLHPEENERV